MSNVLIIKGGRVIDPANKRDAIGDVYSVDGQFVASIDSAQEQEAQVIEAKGKVVCPGFVDLHTHLREPGDKHKETIASGTRAAARGGYTTLVCMSNTKPAVDNPGTVQLIKDAIERHAIVNVLPTGCLTIKREGTDLAPTGSLKKAGVVAVTDGGHCIQNTEIMRRAIEYANMFDLTILDHCQDITLTEDAVMNEGEWSLRLGLRGMPKAAEDIMVARDVILSAQTKAHIHLQHISSAYSIDVIKRAKDRGINITAEVTPHHLALNDSMVKDYDTVLKVLPPLRTEEDRQAAIEGLIHGTLDVISTAHAPHSRTEKDQEFDYAPFGISGLETAFSVCYQTLVKGGHCDIAVLIEKMTAKPAEILNLEAGTLSEGAQADFIIIDPEASWQVDAKKLFTLSKSSPWAGQSLPGVVEATFVKGEKVYELATEPAL